MQLTTARPRWDWIDEGLLPSILAAMRATWVWLFIHIWSSWIQPEHGDMLSPLAVFGLLAGGTFLAQVATIRSVKRWQGMALVSLGGLLALALALYGSSGAPYALWQPGWVRAATAEPLAAILVGIVSAWLWWWGILAGRDRLYYDTYSNNFLLGIALSAVVLAISYGTRIVPPTQALGGLVLFFALGLSALALSSLQITRALEYRRSQQSLTVSRYWFGTVAAVIILLLAGGLLLGQLFSPGFVEAVFAALRAVLNVVADLLWLIIYAVSYVIFYIGERLMRWLAPHGIELEMPKLNLPPPGSEGLEQLPNQPGGAAVPAALIEALRIGSVVLALAAVALLFAFAYRRFQRMASSEEDETHELILSAELLRAQIAGLFRRTGTAAPPPAFAAVGGDEPAAVIRRTYQALLAWAAERGVPRRPGVTTLEYAHLVAQAAPEHRESIDVITAAYQVARYSPQAVPAATAERALRAWSLVQDAGRRTTASASGM